MCHLHRGLKGQAQIVIVDGRIVRDCFSLCSSVFSEFYRKLCSPSECSSRKENLTDVTCLADVAENRYSFIVQAYFLSLLFPPAMH